MNVEDTRNGVAEYVIEKYGEKVIIELKWGQGAKDIENCLEVQFELLSKCANYLIESIGG